MVLHRHSYQTRPSVSVESIQHSILCLLSLVPNCRPERLRLYQHWADTLAIEWGSDINDLVTELEQQQQKLKELYDRAALQVGLRRGVYTQGSTLCLGPDWLVNNLG
jgi:hypothetical protein